METEESKEFVRLLIEALKDPSEEVRQAAGDALEFSTDQEFGADHAAWDAWWKANAETFEFE